MSGPSGGKRPILALAAFAAESEEHARERVGNLRIVKVFLPNGQSVNVGSEEQAAEFARQAGVTDYRIEEKVPSVLHGTADPVRKELDELHRRYGVNEFILDTPALAGCRAPRLHRAARQGAAFPRRLTISKED